MNLSEKAQAFMNKKPTLIGVMLGHKFYEHPTMGDEAPLYVITPEGKIKRSFHWEMPSHLEVMSASDIY